MTERPAGPGRKTVIGHLVDLLRHAGARRLTNGILRLVRIGRRAEPAVPVAPPADHQMPAGPFVAVPVRDAPALLIFVPRSLRSRLIDGATGGYGYSHVAIDCNEVDKETGKRVMIESAPGQAVHRSFIDEYGARPFVRIPLQGKGFDLDTFCACVRSKVGEAYDNMEALTWGEVDDPAKQICSDLVSVCLPLPVLERIAVMHAAGKLPRNSVSAHHRGTPAFHAFVSPNALAAYFGAPTGEHLASVEHLVPVTGRRGRTMRPLRAKLIYNPASGSAGPAGAELAEIVEEMERWHIIPEVHVVTPRSHLPSVAADAVHRGMRLVVVAGGDGTIDNVAGALAGTQATLGIIPGGTRNNVAQSLGIPLRNVVEAVELLRQGRRRRVDVGRACCGPASRWFLEVSVVGLASALYPAADELQHGNLTRVGDLITTFVGAAPSELRLKLDGGGQMIVEDGHVVLVANMPYLGASFHLSSDILCDDGLLDVFVFGGVGKLDLINYAVRAMSGGVDDPRVTHYQATTVDVEEVPPMPVMADGEILGHGSLRVTIRPRSLAVMTGQVSP